MNNRTLQSLIVRTVLFGATTVALAWSGLAYLYGDGSKWAPIANGVIWLVSLCCAGLCYRELRVVGAAPDLGWREARTHSGQPALPATTAPCIQCPCHRHRDRDQATVQ